MEPAKAPLQPELDRRTFVRVATGAAVAGALVSVPALLPPTVEVGRLKTYLGARKVGGPAPKGLPIIPLQLRSDGILEGIPKDETVSGHSMRWYAYCNRAAAPGIRSDYAGDNVLRYHNNPEKMAAAERELGAPLWYADRLGEPVRASDFTEVGQGAPFQWRSEGQEQNNILTGIVIKVDPAVLRGQFTESQKALRLVAFDAACTHFCCLAGWKESRSARDRNEFERIWCTCHDARFDPYELRAYTLPADDDVLATTTVSLTP